DRAAQLRNVLVHKWRDEDLGPQHFAGQRLQRATGPPGGLVVGIRERRIGEGVEAQNASYPVTSAGHAEQSDVLESTKNVPEDQLGEGVLEWAAPETRRPLERRHMTLVGIRVPAPRGREGLAGATAVERDDEEHAG